MRLPKILLPKPLQPVFSGLADVAGKAASHQILLVRMPTLHLGVNVIQRGRPTQVHSAVGTSVLPLLKN